MGPHDNKIVIPRLWAVNVLPAKMDLWSQAPLGLAGTSNIFCIAARETAQRLAKKSKELNMTDHVSDELCINTIRFLAIDTVQKANSGHPGTPMGAAPMAYVLWDRFLKHNPSDTAWPDRDRFILSPGHASALLYSLLHLTGYDVPLEELKQFRQWGNKTPGHPEYGLTPGVEMTTGPLGQGFAHGVGMAMAERWLAEHYNRPGQEIIDHYTYAIVSDGDLTGRSSLGSGFPGGNAAPGQADLPVRRQRHLHRGRHQHRLCRERGPAVPELRLARHRSHRRHGHRGCGFRHTNGLS